MEARCDKTLSVSIDHNVVGVLGLALAGADLGGPHHPIASGFVLQLLVLILLSFVRVGFVGCAAGSLFNSPHRTRWATQGVPGYDRAGERARSIEGGREGGAFLYDYRCNGCQQERSNLGSAAEDDATLAANQPPLALSKPIPVQLVSG